MAELSYTAEQYAQIYASAMATIKKENGKEVNAKIREARRLLKDMRAEARKAGIVSKAQPGVLRGMTGTKTGSYNPQTGQWVDKAGKVTWRLNANGVPVLAAPGETGTPRSVRSPAATATTASGTAAAGRGETAAGTKTTKFVPLGSKLNAQGKKTKLTSRLKAEAASGMAAKKRAKKNVVNRPTTGTERGMVSPRSQGPSKTTTSTVRRELLKQQHELSGIQKQNRELAALAARQQVEAKNLMAYGWNPLESAGSKAGPLTVAQQKSRKRKQSKGRK